MKKYLPILMILTFVSIQCFAQTGAINLRYFQLPANDAITSLKEIPGYHGQKYVFMQFEQIPDYKRQAGLRQNGFNLLTYLSQQLYIVSIGNHANFKFLNDAGFRNFYEIKPAYKIDPALKEYFNKTGLNGGKTEIIINVFRDININELIINEKLPVSVVHFSNALKSMVVNAGYRQVVDLAALPWVKWIGISNIPLTPVNLPSKNHIRSNNLQTGGLNGIPLTGNNVKVGEWDAGTVGNHIDYDNRLIIRNGNSVHSHATHVAGTVCGNGIIDQYYRGMAPGAQLFSWDFYDYIPFEMDSAIGLDSIVITQNSYAYDPDYDSCNFRGRYDWNSAMIDQLTIIYPYYTHVFAAGNYRSQCNLGGFRTISSGFQAGKNSISVAAVYETDPISWFSSWGPMRDGRLKPEVSAVGVNVKSTQPNNLYSGNWNGTSMACPAVSGTIAQLFEGYKNIYGIFPVTSVIKAIICNTAIDRGNPGPDYKYGFGIMNGLQAYNAILNHHFLYDSLSQGSSYTDTLVVAAPVTALKVLLCWSDLPADAYVKSDSSALINLLNLSVFDTSGNSYLPLILDPVNPNAVAIPGVDTLNNTQQVVINNIQPGKYIVKVNGTHIPLGRQTFALSYEQIKPDLKITFPAGNEKLLPATTYAIRWDPNNLTGYYQLGYSIDSGNNWTTINNSVNIQNRYYHWQTPDTFSSACSVRLVKSGDTLINDTFFSISARPAGLASVPCNNQITLKWNPVSFADSYRVYLLDTNALWQVTGTVQDTFYTITGLSNINSYWLTVASVYPSGLESQKAFAINASPDSTLFPPLIILDIGSDTICSGSNKLFTTNTSGTQPLNYLWFKKNVNNPNWDSLNLATDTFLSLSSLVADDDKTQYRLQVVNVCQGPVYSSTALIRVDTGINFLLPADTVIRCEQDTISFIQSFQSISPVNLLWQQSIDNGNNWSIINGKTDSFLVLSNLDHSMDQNLYRLTASSVCVTGVVSPANLLRVHPSLNINIINSQDTICYGNIITLSVQKSGGDSLSYSVTWTGTAINGDLLTDTLYADKTFIVRLTDSCSFYKAYDTVTIHVLPRLGLSLSAPVDSLCAGQSITFTATPTGGDTNNYAIQWNDSMLAGFTNTFIPQQSGLWKAVLSDGCSSTPASDSISLFVRPELSLQLFSKADTVCFGSSISITATASGGDSNGYSVLWNGNISSGFQFSTLADSSSWFNATLSDNCSTQNATDSVLINVLQPLGIKLVPDSFSPACYGNTILLEAIPSGGNGHYTFNWNDSLMASGSFSKQMFNSQWISVEISDQCSLPDAFDSIFVPVLPPLEVHILHDDDTVCYGSSIKLRTKASGGIDSLYSFSWEPPLSTSGQLTDSISGNTWYKVSLNDNCSLFSSSDSVQIFIEKIDAQWQFNADYLNVNFSADDSLQKQYLWIIDMKDSLSGFKSFYRFDTTSSHSVCLYVTSFKSCVDSFCDSINVYINGINKSEHLQSIRVFPNPVTEYLVVKINTGKSISNLSISDLTGKVVTEHVLSPPGKGEFLINFSHLPKGAYILRVTDTDGMIYLTKLLKQ